MQRQNLLMAGCIAIMVSGCCSLHHRPEIFKPPGLRQDAYLSACGPIYQPTPLYPADPMHRLKSLRRKKHRNKDSVYSPLPYPGMAYPVDPCAPVAGFHGAYPVMMNPQLYSSASESVVYGIQASLPADDCGCDAMGGPLLGTMPAMNPYGVAVPVAPMMWADDSCGCQQLVEPTCDSCVNSGTSVTMPMASHVMPVVPARPMPLQPVYKQPLHSVYQHPVPVVSQQMPVVRPSITVPVADVSCLAPSDVMVSEPGCQIPQQTVDPSCSIPDVMWMQQEVSGSALNPPVPPEQTTTESVEFGPSPGNSDAGSQPTDMTPFDDPAEPSMPSTLDESPSQEFTPLPMDVDQTSWQQPIEITPPMQIVPGQTEAASNSRSLQHRVVLPGHRIVTREVRPIPADQ